MGRANQWQDANGVPWPVDENGKKIITGLKKKKKRARGREGGERAANIGGKSRGKLDSRYIKQLDASDTQADARTTNDY